MKVVILGAGIAGLIAAGVFSGKENEVLIIEKNAKDNAFSNHSAILRLRNDKIREYVKCNLEKIRVRKEVYYDGALHSVPSIAMNNMYSRKTHDSLGFRSLNELGLFDRYLISDIENDFNVFYNTEFKDIDKTSHCIIARDEHGEFYLPYDICISTIPMPTILNIINENATDFRANPVHTYISDIGIESSVYQTIYFPESEFHVYRASIEGRRLTVECTDDISDTDMRFVRNVFGLDNTEAINSKRTVQNLGKLIPVDDTCRRRAIVHLTKEYDLYSFGRFAVWKNLRIDQILEDIEKIKLMVKVSHGSWYERLQIVLDEC